MSFFKTGVRDEGFLQFLRGQSCCICGRWEEGGISPHHIGDGILPRRSRDDLAVPMCFRCHRKEHDAGTPSREKLTKIALMFWKQYKGET